MIEGSRRSRRSTISAIRTGIDVPPVQHHRAPAGRRREVVWDETDAKKIKPAKFTARATFATYGCNQGEVGGLADRVRDLWKIRTIGSQGQDRLRDDRPGADFPEECRRVLRISNPSLAAGGKAWSYPARRALTAPVLNALAAIRACKKRDGACGRINGFGGDRAW